MATTELRRSLFGSTAPAGFPADRPADAMVSTRRGEGTSTQTGNIGTDREVSAVDTDGESSTPTASSIPSGNIGADGNIGPDGKYWNRWEASILMGIKCQAMAVCLELSVMGMPSVLVGVVILSVSGVTWLVSSAVFLW